MNNPAEALQIPNIIYFLINDLCNTCFNCWIFEMVLFLITSNMITQIPKNIINAMALNVTIHNGSTDPGADENHIGNTTV